MQSLLFSRANTLVWRDVPEPTVAESTDALVRPFIAARCDGDAVFLQNDVARTLRLAALLHIAERDFSGTRTNPFAAPFAYGHECVAEVIACGAEVREFRVGDVVVVPWSISCGACSRCTAGLTSKCLPATRGRQLAAFGFGDAIGGHGGALSDLLRVPWADAMLVRVPTGVDPMALASASDNIPDGYRSVAPLLANAPGAPVLVVGGSAKSIGLYAAGIAKALGSSRVDYIDTSRTRLAIAEQLGAHAVPRVERDPWYRRGSPVLAGGYPITVDASGTIEGLHYAIRALAPGGTCTALGFYLRRGTALPLWNMYMNSVTLRVGISHPRADLPGAVSLIERGLFDPTKVTTLIADWDDAPRALRERSTKVVLRRSRALHRRAVP